VKRVVVQQFLIAGISGREFVEQFKNAHPAASVSVTGLNRRIIRFGAYSCGEILQKITEVVNVAEIPAAGEVFKRRRTDALLKPDPFPIF
jgi:hypothetical protein